MMIATDKYHVRGDGSLAEHIAHCDRCTIFKYPASRRNEKEYLCFSCGRAIKANETVNAFRCGQYGIMEGAVAICDECLFKAQTDFVKDNMRTATTDFVERIKKFGGLIEDNDNETIP